MLLFILFVIAAATLLILPGWLLTRRRLAQPTLLPLPGVGVLFWCALATLAGGGSPVNLVLELGLTGVAAAVCAYLVMLTRLGHWPAFAPHLALACIVLALWLLIPVLPA